MNKHQFRTRPSVIEARQFDGSLGSGSVVAGWSGGVFATDAVDGSVVMIDTGETQVKARRGDWVVKNQCGHWYVLTDEEFNAKFESVPIAEQT